jgi:CubicO group peptidase (beta-lactamase class C family)
MDPEKLARLPQVVRHEGLNLHSLLIIRNGSIVSETYFQPYTAETDHQVYSVTKSVVATLVGIAIDKGYIDGVGQPVANFFHDDTFQRPNAGSSGRSTKPQPSAISRPPAATLARKHSRLPGRRAARSSWRRLSPRR